MIKKDDFMVLLADDDPDDRDLFSSIIKKISQDITIQQVENGTKLMKFLQNTDHLPDILFLDLNMPNMDGFECLHLIKTDDNFKEIPVVIFTTSDYFKDVEKTYKSGGDFYIQKPNSYKDLFQIFKEQLLV